MAASHDLLTAPPASPSSVDPGVSTTPGYAGRSLTSPAAGGPQPTAVTVLRADWVAPVEVSLVRLSSGERARLAFEWERCGLREHAAVAAGARFALQLMSLGAPPELMEAAYQAMRDKTEYARLAFGLASAYRGQTVGPGPLDVEHRLQDNGLVSVLATVITDGCIAGTVASLEAVEALAAVRDSVLRQVLEKVARDEQRHAELGWRFLHWVLGERSDLRAVARGIVGEQVRDAQRALTQAEPDPASDWLLRNGLVSEGRRRELRVQVLRDVVVPSLDALCEKVGRAAA